MTTATNRPPTIWQALARLCGNVPPSKGNLGVKAIPAHWSLTDSWQTGVNPERLADDAKFWDVIHHR